MRHADSTPSGNVFPYEYSTSEGFKVLKKFDFIWLSSLTKLCPKALVYVGQYVDYKSGALTCKLSTFVSFGKNPNSMASMTRPLTSPERLDLLA